MNTHPVITEFRKKFPKIVKTNFMGNEGFVILRSDKEQKNIESFILTALQKDRRNLIKYLKQFVSDESRHSTVDMYNQGYYQAINDVETYSRTP